MDQLKSDWEIYRIARETPEAVMQCIKDIGSDYVGLLVPNEPMNQRGIDKINRISAQARKLGMKLQYHNVLHGYNNMNDGLYRMEYILDNTDPDVLFEPDLG